MDNIILIGMPGVGKSTIGVVLAKVLGYGFVDTDLLIQNEMQMKLSEIIKLRGIDGFKEIENRVNVSIQANRTVIATGGSVVYCQEAMEHLKTIGKVIYLQLSLKSLSSRLGNLRGRGVVLKDGQSLEELFLERTPLYEKYADVVIDEENKNLEETLQIIFDHLNM